MVVTMKIALLVFGSVVAEINGKCVMYDACGVNPDFPGTLRNLNCFYNGDPVPIDSEAQALMAEICPHFIEELGPQPDLCCSKNTLRYMIDQYKIAEAILGRCPSCWYNFRKTFCTMTCHPDQASFVEVTETVNGPAFNGTDVKMVKAVEYRLSRSYIDSVYKSCKDVVNPSTSGLALDIMCGSWGSSLCTPERLFGFMGSTSNGYAPMTITYDFVEEGSSVGYYDSTALGCNERPSANESGCSCTDCEAACTPPEFAPPSSDLRIGDADGVMVIMIIIFCLGAITIILCSVRNCAKVKDINSYDVSKDEKKTMASFIESAMSKVFYSLGFFCASHPLLVIVSSLMVSGVLVAGIYFIDITTDPIELWAAPTSQSRIEKNFFDSHFRPFFRTEQIIITSKGIEPFNYTDLFGENIQVQPIFRKDFMVELLKLIQGIESVVAEDGTTLQDVCFMPLYPDKAICNINSIWAYWQDRLEELERTGITSSADGFNHTDTYLDHLLLCSRNPVLPRTQTAMGQGCMSKGGVPVQPYYALGGLQDDSSVVDATASIINILLNNFDPLSTSKAVQANLTKALNWERAYIKFMHNWTETRKPDFMDVAYRSESSIEDELNRATFDNIDVVILSYAVMFFYIILALGQVSHWRRFLVEAKFSLGFFGVLIVIWSVVASVGLYSYGGIPATLIVFQIIPFLVLAVGIDNIFILVQTYDQTTKVDSVPYAIADVCGQVVPSMFISTVAQSLAFFLGALSDMPAVKAFALYAAMALLINFLMQITCFISIMALDFKRQARHKVDVFCCLRAEKETIHTSDGFLTRFIKRFYAPFLFNRWIRPIVLVGFLGLVCLSLAVIPKIEVGLNPELTMPQDSYAQKHLNYLKKYLSVGPPVYFVINATSGTLDLTSNRIQNRICGGSGCDSDSLQSQIKLWSKQPNVTYIARPAQSWMDDYFSWSEGCCLEMSDFSDFCPSSPSAGEEEEYYYDYGNDYDSSQSAAPTCQPCASRGKKRPSPAEFYRYISYFLLDNPSESCPFAGHAAYSSAIDLNPSNETFVAASSFFTFHTVLKTERDYFEALRWARRLASNLTEALKTDKNTEVNVFPYSVFYVFYEQYLDMWSNLLQSLGISVGSVFIVLFIFSGFDLPSVICSLLTIIMILIDIGGAMYFLDIPLNAVSMVNLVMTVGISVEICSHFIRTFTLTIGDSKLERSRTTLERVGGLLFAGIHITNFLGVIILSLSQMQMMHLFFFQMYLALVVLGALHGLVFLPVLLTTCLGPKVNQGAVQG